VEDRSRRGPFRSADDLQRVSGIGPITVDKNRHRIVVQ
jgi:DNA uptake protein ComE-like DNA-binding protein